ncbi:MAG: hypothetical protein JW779_02675 [Candidatus Thorarchaeota archaeon]|nr:hypothetical protein [Candidatus Thorarchaeota archaeon]
MLYEQITDEPRLASKSWMTDCTEPLIPGENNDMLASVFTGTGVLIHAHPLNKRIAMRGCGNCESMNVLVIYAQWSVSTASGDAYWDYEILCNDCQKYTSRSFSEN